MKMRTLFNIAKYTAFAAILFAIGLEPGDFVAVLILIVVSDISGAVEVLWFYDKHKQ